MIKVYSLLKCLNLSVWCCVPHRHQACQPVAAFRLDRELIRQYRALSFECALEKEFIYSIQEIISWSLFISRIVNIKVFQGTFHEQKICIIVIKTSFRQWMDSSLNNPSPCNPSSSHHPTEPRPRRPLTPVILRNHAHVAPTTIILQEHTHDAPYSHHASLHISFLVWVINKPLIQPYIRV